MGSSKTVALALVVGLAGSVVAVVGCATTAEVPDPPPTSMVPLPASSEPELNGPEEEAVFAAYQGYWETWLAANSPPNPEHPGLERYYTGESLERARSAIAENLAHGVTHGESAEALYRHEPSVRSIRTGVALVDDCAVDDGLVIGPDGTVLDDRVVTNRSVATLRKVSGEWRVEDVEVITQREGVATCEP